MLDLGVEFIKIISIYEFLLLWGKNLYINSLLCTGEFFCSNYMIG